MRRGRLGSLCFCHGRRRPYSTIRGGVASPRMCNRVAQRALSRRKRERLRELVFASWNVRTLVNEDGPVQTARRRIRPQGTYSVTEDRKIDLVVRELLRYGV